MTVESRLKRIERALEPDGKGKCLKFPCPDGTFIEVPGCRTLIDVLARVANEKTRRNSGRN